MPGGGNGGWIKVERVRGRLVGVPSGGSWDTQGIHEDQWVCYVCEQTKNYATRKTCRKCGCTKDGVVQAKAAARKGKLGFGKEAGQPANPLTKRGQQITDQQKEKEVKELRAKVVSLTAKLAMAEATGPDPEGKKAEEEAGGADKQVIKALQKQIQSLKTMEEGLRDRIFADKGSHASCLAELEAQLQNEWAKLRNLKPLAQQKASAEAHLKRKQKCCDDAAEALQKLKDEQEALEAKMVKQKAVLAEAEAALLQAKVEAVAVAEKATAELRGDGKAGTYTQCSMATASAVKDFFQKLPAAVTQDMEGQVTIKQVMALLEKLDTAAHVAAAMGVSHTAGAHTSGANQQSVEVPTEGRAAIELDNGDMDYGDLLDDDDIAHFSAQEGKDRAAVAKAINARVKEKMASARAKRHKSVK